MLRLYNGEQNIEGYKTDIEDAFLSLDYLDYDKCHKVFTELEAGWLLNSKGMSTGYQACVSDEIEGEADMTKSRIMPLDYISTGTKCAMLLIMKPDWIINGAEVSVEHRDCIINNITSGIFDADLGQRGIEDYGDPIEVLLDGKLFTTIKDINSYIEGVY